jgi:hypothetical protein
MKKQYTDIESVDINKDVRAVTIPTMSEDEYDIFTKKLEKDTTIDKLSNALEDEHLPEEEKNKIKQTLAAYLTSLAGIDSLGDKEPFEELLGKEDIDTDDILIKDILPKKSKGGKLTGKEALMVAHNQMGISGIKRISLINSGFNIVVGNVSVSDLLELDFKLYEQKVTIGRNTTSLGFSNESVVYIDIIMEFVKDHIIATTLVIDKEEDILSYISIQDLPALLLGLTSVMRPRGFKALFTCTNVKDDEPCDELFTATLDADVMLYEDRTRLTETCKGILGNTARGSVSKEDLVTYQQELGTKHKELVIDAGNIKSKVILKLPTIRENIQAGLAWIEDTVSTIDEMLTEAPGDERDRKYGMLHDATILNNYAHFVSRLYITEESYVEDLEDILSILGSYSSNQEFSKQFVEGVKTLLKENMLSVVGVASYTCDTCAKDVVSDEIPKTFEQILPVNMLQVFFGVRTLDT